MTAAAKRRAVVALYHRGLDVAAIATALGRTTIGVRGELPSLLDVVQWFPAP